MIIGYRSAHQKEEYWKLIISTHINVWAFGRRELRSRKSTIFQRSRHFMTNYFVPTLHLIRATPVIDHIIAQNHYPLIAVANLRFYHISARWKGRPVPAVRLCTCIPIFMKWPSQECAGYKGKGSKFYIYTSMTSTN